MQHEIRMAAAGSNLKPKSRLTAAKLEDEYMDGKSRSFFIVFRSL